MVLAERCALLSAEILKSQGKYSEAATLLIKMTSEVSLALHVEMPPNTVHSLKLCENRDVYNAWTSLELPSFWQASL